MLYKQHALGYIGGYLLHSEILKIAQANHPKNHDMIEALQSFKESDEDIKNEEDGVPQWTKI